jgi:CBS domain-containing protein
MNDTIRFIVQKLNDNNVRRVWLVGEEDKLLGVVSLRDVLSYLVTSQPKEEGKEKYKPTDKIKASANKQYIYKLKRSYSDLVSIKKQQLVTLPPHVPASEGTTPSIPFSMLVRLC